MAPPRRSVRLARELVCDRAQRLVEHHINPHVLRHLCREADVKITDGDRDCLRVARLCCRIAGRLETEEARALAFGRLASALRLAGRLEAAKRSLEHGLVNAPLNVSGDLLRRRSIIRLYEGRVSAAARDAKRALQCTSGIEHAWALEALGAALYEGRKYRAAINTFAQCLVETLPGDIGPYCNAIHNYATALSQGTDEEVAEAVALCSELRPRLKYRHKMQRAKLWWTEGLLHERLGDSYAAWRSLDNARRSLIAMGVAPEMAAIVADMARVSAEPVAIRELCDNAAAMISATHPLIEPLQSLASAARAMIPEAAAALRDAASRLAPCPAV